MSIGGAIMIGYGWARGAPAVESLVGLAVTIVAGGSSAADIYSIWQKCGTF